ncbi:MAG: hypothetical protein FWG59_06710 [Betaproteobacteria bacterium]|nr:hypothetical protein [Betaproteobacteria bacterium]
MDSKHFFSVANETYPLQRRPQSSPPKKTLLAGVNLLIGDMQTSTRMTRARETAMQDWARLHNARAPEHTTGTVLSRTI